MAMCFNYITLNAHRVGDFPFLGLICKTLFNDDTFMKRRGVVVMWRRDVVVITTAQLHLTKPQVLRRFKSCSRLAGDSRWWGSLTMTSAGNKAKRFSSVNHKQLIIIITKWRMNTSIFFFLFFILRRYTIFILKFTIVV